MRFLVIVFSFYIFRLLTFGLIDQAFLDLFFSGMLAVFVVFSLVNRNGILRLAVDEGLRDGLRIFALIFVSYLIGLWNGFSISAGVMVLAKHVLILLIYILALSCGQSSDRAYYIFVALIALVFHSFLGVMMFMFGVGEEVHGVLRATGVAGQVQTYANLAMLSALVSIPFYLFGKHQLEKSGGIVGSFVGVLAIWASATLKNLLVFFLVFPLYFRDVRKGKLIFACALVFLTSVMLIFIFFDDFIDSGVGKRIQTIIAAGIRTELEQGEKLESSLVWRLMHWSKLLTDWYENYFLLGAGVGNVAEMNGLKMANGEGFIAHSDFVGFFVELGPLLFVLFVWLHVRIVVRVWRCYSKQDPFSIYYMLTAVSAISLYVSSIAGNVYYSAAHMYFLWFLFGWVSGARISTQMEKAQ